MPATMPAAEADGTAGPGRVDVPRRRRTATVVLGVLLVLTTTSVVVAGLNAVRAQERTDELSARLTDTVAERDAAAGRAEAAEGRIRGAEARASEAEMAASERQAELDDREAGLDERKKALDEREKAISKAEKRQAETRISEGTWTVGDDVEPGTYRTTEAVSGQCYWGIYRSGTNKDDIVENDIVTGGFPTVTLTEGQDFTTTRCGTWDKQ